MSVANVGDKMSMTTTVDRHPKSGSRKWSPQDYEGFDYGYQGIDWSKKSKNPVEIDPDAPVCIVCSGKSAEGDCPACG